MGLTNLEQFQSKYVPPRGVSVWRPDNADGPLPVIYVHDGQNLFEPERSYIGVDWGVDEALSRLIHQGRVPAAMVVGVWNTPRRLDEYMPDHPWADDYLRFLVEELKPTIDRNYSTLTGPEHTSVMGSSMGGLISLYALCEYPRTFGAAGCVSTHWPAGDGLTLDCMRRDLPSPGRHRIYFDYGTETADAPYEPYQHKADHIMWSRGYRQPENWVTLKFHGADHSERAWRERIHRPLEFLLTGRLTPE